MAQTPQVMVALAGALAAVAITAQAAAQVGDRFEPVEQVVEDMTPLSTSLRQLQVGLHRPMTFDEVFHVPGEPGKFMRVHGGLYAVFPQSMYLVDRDRNTNAIIPPNTVFRIGPRMAPGYVLPPSLPGQSAPPRPGEVPAGQVVPVGYAMWAMSPLDEAREPARSMDAVLPPPLHAQDRPEDEPVKAPDGEATPGDEVQQDESWHAPGTIIGDQQYRQQRLRKLLEKAAASEAGAT